MRVGFRAARLALLGAALMLPVGFAAAEDPGVAAIIKTRQHKLKDIVGKDAKEISDQLKSGSLDKATIQSDAGEIDKTLKDLPTWFPKGSGPEAGIKTAAKSEIWEQPDQFHKAYEDAQAAADNFAKVAETSGGDPSAVGPAFMTLGRACGGCHKPFRVKQEGQ